MMTEETDVDTLIKAYGFDTDNAEVKLLVSIMEAIIPLHADVHGNCSSCSETGGMYDERFDYPASYPCDTLRSMEDRLRIALNEKSTP